MLQPGLVGISFAGADICGELRAVISVQCIAGTSQYHWASATPQSSIQYGLLKEVMMSALLVPIDNYKVSIIMSTILSAVLPVHFCGKVSSTSERLAAERKPQAYACRQSLMLQ